MNDLASEIANELDAMWRFALRLAANEADAEDLVQRTCVKALESEDRYQARGKLRSWLFRIEHRIWLNVLRSRKIRDRGSFRYTAAGLHAEQSGDSADSMRDPITWDTPETALQYQQIVDLVESLPEAQRTVVLLVCVEGFTYTETADILDVPVGTIMSRLSRARITLGRSALSHQAFNASIKSREEALY